MNDRMSLRQPQTAGPKELGNPRRSNATTTATWGNAARQEQLSESSDLAPMRATTVRPGLEGALIGPGGPVALHASPDGTVAPIAEVADGAPIVVLAVKEGWVQVRVRTDERTIEGWADRTLLGVEPRLTQDDKKKNTPDPYLYSKMDGELFPAEPSADDPKQGRIGDCYLVASMAAIASASPETIRQAITYDETKGTYTVRFHVPTGKREFRTVLVEVDEYLPTTSKDRADPVFAGEADSALWPAIIEKAYAKWKGGYDKLDKGGSSAQTLQDITGAPSARTEPSSLKEDAVIPWFMNAEKAGTAICASTIQARTDNEQRPFTSDGKGHFKAKLSQVHEWNEVIPGTLQVVDVAGKGGKAQDKGVAGAEAGAIVGTAVASGKVDYKKSMAEMAFDEGLAPEKGEDLKVNFSSDKVLDADVLLIARHAYAFDRVVDDQLKFRNPWGKFHPGPITAAQFLEFFDDIATAQPPTTGK